MTSRFRWSVPSLALSFLLLSGGAEASPASKGTGVIVNRVELTSSQWAHLTRTLGQPIVPGRYWYDRRCGAWGVEGHGTAGFIRAGLKVGGRLRADASRGRTQVFVNGRQLATSDVVALTHAGIPVYPGRYWLNADGTGGIEGGPARFNLLAIAKARAPRRQKRLFSTYDLTGISVMSDGSGTYVFNRDGHSFSSTR